MDTITHGLLGAAIAEVGFRRRLGGRSVVWGGLVAAAPDLDFVAMLGGEWNELVHHRGISHSLVAMAVAAPVLGALAWRWPGRRQGSIAVWMALSAAALVSHALLDTCTSYGTQLFAPISDARFAIDAVAIIDLFYSIPLLAVVLRAGIGKDRSASARFAGVVLGLTSAYLAFGYVQSRRAVAWAEEELAAMQFRSVETRALPTMGNLFVYRVVARDGSGRSRLAILSLSAPRTPRWYALSDDEDPLVDAALTSERGALFVWFAMDMVHAELEHEDHGFVVRISDLRYGSVRDPRRAMWGAEARFALEGELESVERWNRREELDVKGELGTLWAHLVGDDAKIRAEMAAGLPPRAALRDGRPALPRRDRCRGAPFGATLARDDARAEPDHELRGDVLGAVAEAPVRGRPLHPLPRARRGRHGHGLSRAHADGRGLRSHRRAQDDPWAPREGADLRRHVPRRGEDRLADQPPERLQRLRLR